MKKTVWNYFLGLIILFGFYYLSKAIVDFLNIQFPATILGLILLYISLCLKIIKLDFVENIANFFIKNMPILFAPFIVGLIVQKELLLKNLAPIIVIVFTSSAVTMILCGLIVEKWLNHLNCSKQGEKNV